MVNGYAISVLVLGTSYLCGVLPGIIFLVLAFDIVAALIGVQDLGQRVSIALLVISPFIATYTLGALTDRYAFPNLKRRYFSAFIVSACGALYFTEEFVRSWESLSTLSAVSVMPFVTKLISAVFFCAGICALVLTVLALAWELPFLWMTEKFSVRLGEVSCAVRPLVIGTLLALSANLILGLFCAEFNVLKLIQGLT